MSVQHASLTGASVHECKQISTAATTDAGKIITPSGTSAGQGVLRKLYPDELDHSSPSRNVTGFNLINDSQYTSGSPRALTSGSRVKLTNNALGTGTTQTRLGTLWLTGSNAFSISDANSVYTLVIRMKATTGSPAGTPYGIDLELDVGGVVIAGNTHFIKGGAAVNFISQPLPFYVGPTVLSGNLDIYVRPDTNMSIYDVGFLLTREYKES